MPIPTIDQWLLGTVIVLIRSDTTRQLHARVLNNPIKLVAYCHFSVMGKSILVDDGLLGNLYVDV
jgi:hypothetical protein